MLHVIALNVAGAGYTTYAGDPATGLSPQPLGMATPAVPERVLEALQQLDRDARRTSNEALVRLFTDPQLPALLLYAVHLTNARDDLGRSGLVFLHGVLLPEALAAGAALDALRPQLAAGPLLALGTEVARVARDPNDPALFLRQRCLRVEAVVTTTPGPRISLDAADATLVMPTFAHDGTTNVASGEPTLVHGRRSSPPRPGRGVVAGAFLLGATVSLVPLLLRSTPPVEPSEGAPLMRPTCDAGVVIVRGPPAPVVAIDAGVTLLTDAPSVDRAPSSPSPLVRRPRTPVSLPDARRPNASPPLE